MIKNKEELQIKILELKTLITDTNRILNIKRVLIKDIAEEINKKGEYIIKNPFTITIWYRYADGDFDGFYNTLEAIVKRKVKESLEALEDAKEN